MPEIDMFADENGGDTLTLTKKDKERVQYLVRVLTELARQHGLGEPTIDPDTKLHVSDLQFDKMWAELEKLDPTAIKTIGNASAAPLDPNAKKVKHEPPMTSIKKANGTIEERTEEFDKWVKLLAKELNLTIDEVLKRLVTSYKHDGCALSVKYVNGDLISAGLRPRHGVWGEDVTENVKYVLGLPQKLPLPLTLVLRGEIECKISTFNKLNGTAAVDSQEFANPRNYTTGSIRQYKDPTVTKSRQLSFMGYSILEFADARKYFKTETERAKWCNQVLKVPFVRTESYRDGVLGEMELKVPDLDYEVDGIVLSIDDLELQDQLGTYGNQIDSNPRGKLAYKFNDETADPKIKTIVWETGRTGSITPVANFNGVKLAGTTVQRATAFSLGFLVRNNIHEGTQIKIRKSGKIIPEVLGHFEGTQYALKKEAGDKSLPNTFDLSKFSFPQTCPSCGKKTKLVNGNSHGMISLECENNTDCPSQNIKRFVNYLEKFGVKGLGIATVEQIIEAGFVKSFSDLYILSINDLRDAGRSIRESLLDIARIHMVNAPEQIKDNQQLAHVTIDAMKRKKHISLSSFIACLGIPGSSKGTGSSLALHFRTIGALLSASEAQILEVADIGEKTAKTVFEFLQTHRSDIETLDKDHLYIEGPKSGRYTGKNFVFTGSPGTEGKDYWKQRVEDEGGVVKSSVGKDVDFVVVGTDPGSKYEKAKELKAKGHKLVIVESHFELEKMFT